MVARTRASSAPSTREETPMRPVRCTRFRAVIALSCVVWWAGCAEDQTRLAPTEDPAQSDLATDRMAQSERDEFPTIPRLEPSLQAIGPFRPGVPIKIRSSTKAN